MYFGMNRTKDEESLATFLEYFSHKRLTSELIPRMSDEEINSIVDLLTSVMRNHLSSDEYHKLFLNEEHHHH